MFPDNEHAEVDSSAEVGGRGYAPDSPPWTPDLRIPTSPTTLYSPGPASSAYSAEEHEAAVAEELLVRAALEQALRIAREHELAEEHEQAGERFVTAILEDILELQLAKVEGLLEEIEARRMVQLA